VHRSKKGHDGLSINPCSLQSAAKGAKIYLRQSGLLYLNQGVFNGERILPEGWDSLVSTAGPVQPAGNEARYGGQFWFYGGQEGLPSDAYSPSGGMGQYAMIIRSRNVVIVRRGYDVGARFPIARFSADILEALE